MEPYWDLIERIITESDLVLEILDARLIMLSRNERVEELIREVDRPMIFVINKIDLVDKESLKEEAEKLKEIGEVVYLSTKKRGMEKILLAKIKQVFRKHGKREIFERGPFDPKPEYREARADLVVGVLGYPNVGKSSVINRLCHKKKVKVSKKSGTTHGIHWVKLNDEIKLIDSPGVIPLQKEDEVRYGLIGALDRERLKNPDLVAHAIIKHFLKNDKKKFEEFYGIKISDEDPFEVIEAIGKKKGHLKKGGVIDENKAIAVIVKDWQMGDLRL